LFPSTAIRQGSRNRGNGGQTITRTQNVGLLLRVRILGKCTCLGLIFVSGLRQGVLNPPARLQEMPENGRKRKDEAQSTAKSHSVAGLGQPARSECSTEPVPVEHSEPETRIRKWIIDSRSIGRVELVYDEDKPDQAVVAGVKYRSDELKTLFGKRLRRKDILAVHEIKGVFEGRILG